MEARELRIGNLVYDKLNEFIGCVHYIGSDITELNVVRAKEIEAEIRVSRIVGRGSVYEPIELTEKWLLKFGFEGTKDSCFFHEDFDAIYFKDGVFCYSPYEPCGYTKIKYVHQLQNLYSALTGKELECQL